MCKDFDKNKQYKFINGTNCYNFDFLPDGEIIYDNERKLLICNESDNFFYENESCQKKFNCYKTCEECIGEFIDEYNQKCTKCKKGYVLENGNCLCKEFNKNYCNISSINSCYCLECKEGFYIDKQNKNCEKYKEHCKTCDHGGEINNEHCS